MGNIALITYDAPHRKTQDVLWELSLRGFKDITLVALPFHERKQHRPLFPHRPSVVNHIHPKQMASMIGVNYVQTKPNELDAVLCDFQFILIGGAGIIPEKVCTLHDITNSHPGYLPQSRGLDAFKWAIYNGMPVGVTTHIISSVPDEGKYIDRKIVQIYFEDTFHSVAWRVYELEIQMLCESLELESQGELISDMYELHSRMPNHLETIMMQRFEHLRNKSNSRLS